MWRQASLPAVEGGILPPGKKLCRAKRSEFTGVSFVVTPVRRAGSHGSTSAKMADATFSDRLSEAACFVCFVYFVVPLKCCGQFQIMTLTGLGRGWENPPSNFNSSVQQQY
jgi:hypothetical protein